MMRLPSKWSCAGLGLCLSLTVASAATHTVSVAAFVFTPKVLTVTNGDTVMWTGAGGSHTISPRTGVTEPFCGSDAVNSCTVMFNSVGSFPYQCNFHAGFGFNMTGLVRVVAAPLPPVTVSITNPANGALFAAPATVPVGVSASSSTGVIVNILLFTNGTLAASNGLGAFDFTLNNLSVGNYALRVRATDDISSGGSTSAPVNIRIVNRPSLGFGRGSNGPVQIQFGTVTGVNYVVESATALTNFSSTVTNPGSGGAVQFSETNGGPSQRTYRLRLQ